MTLPRHLRLAVIIFPNAFPTDFIGPLDILNTLRPDQSTAKTHDVSIKTTILAETAEPVVLTGGMRVVPDMTFEQALSVRNGHGEGEPGEGDAADRGWDAVLVPGGGGARPHLESNRAARDFLREVVPSLSVVLTVCTGSWLLASTGVLDGQRATTNKSAYKACLANTKDRPIDWVPKARWVVSDKYWTSSGVTAGIDMTAAFLKHFLAGHLGAEQGDKVANELLGVLEVIAHESDDDPWAEYWGVS